MLLPGNGLTVTIYSFNHPYFNITSHLSRQYEKGLDGGSPQYVYIKYLFNYTGMTGVAGRLNPFLLKFFWPQTSYSPNIWAIFI